MPRSSSPRPAGKKPAKKPIDQYEHVQEKRLNNPPVGLVNPENDPESTKKTYQYDPQREWAGKADHTSFEVPTVSLGRFCIPFRSQEDCCYDPGR